MRSWLRTKKPSMMLGSFLLPCALFFLVQQGLWWSLDLSDLPGAAGTLHMQEAMLGSYRSTEINYLYIVMNNLGFSFLWSAWFFSFLGVMLSYVGLLLGGYAYGGRDAARYLAWLLLFWSPLHQYGWLIGVDSLSVGVACFGTGLIWLAFRHPKWGWLGLIPAGLLLSKGVELKLLVAPVLLCALLAPFAIQKKHKMLAVVALFSIAAVGFAFPQISSDGQLQGGLRIPEVDWLPIAMGWDRLQNMSNIGMPEGKWDQLIVLCVVGTIVGLRAWYVRFFPAIVAILILVVTAFILEDRLSTRLLFPAAFGVLVLLPSLFLRWPKIIVVIVLGMFLDFWAFVDQWQERRVEWAKSVITA